MTIASQHRGLRMAAALAFLLPAGLLAGAYISQYGFGLYPCEMCWWQRYPHFFALPLALLSVMAMQRGQEQGARRWATLAAIAVAVSGLIGAFHAGVEYGWWEGFTACTSTVTPEPGESYLDAIMRAPITRCDVAPWTLFGVSLAGFNFLLSCGGAAVILWLSRKTVR